jgi:hypothetical protein
VCDVVSECTGAAAGDVAQPATMSSRMNQRGMAAYIGLRDLL